MNYYIADTHFGHEGVIALDKRPFGSVKDMEDTLVGNWNAVVRPEDTVYIIGDFCWGKADEWVRILRLLSGSKVLIEGNHDLKQHQPELRREFTDIKPYKEISDGDRKVILSHYPMPFYKHSNNAKYFMLCGHVHNTEENALLEMWTHELRQNAATTTKPFANLGQIYNVGVMMPWMHYSPRTLDQITTEHKV